MGSMRSLLLSVVADVLRIAEESEDPRLVSQEVLDSLWRSIPAEGAVFFLPGEMSAWETERRLSPVILRNLEEKYNQDYQRCYWKLDPLQLGRRGVDELTVRRPVQAVDYKLIESSRYYKEFLEPQGIHYKLVVNLTHGRRLMGRIVLTRPKKSRSFADGEVTTARRLSPYLSHALAHSELRRLIRLKDTILQFVESRSDIGILLVDPSLRVIHRNAKATKTLRRLCGPACNNDEHEAYSRLLQDCREMAASPATGPHHKTAPPRRRIILDTEHHRYLVKSQMVTLATLQGELPFFVVSIEEMAPQPLDFNQLSEAFQLSRRELEVAIHVYKGMKNAEIAEKLFISEVTVKKHLQNIYSKVGVKSRTALIHSMLTK